MLLDRFLDYAEDQSGQLVIGGRRFKFMHGHEVDPLVGPNVQRFGRMIGMLGYLLEFRQGTCVLTDDAITVFDWTAGGPKLNTTIIPA